MLTTETKILSDANGKKNAWKTIVKEKTAALLTESYWWFAKCLN